MTWMLSTSEDYWDCGEEYNMRDEALACVADFCKGHDVESCYVGRATRLTYNGLLTTGIVERLCDNMNEHEDALGCEDYVVETDAKQLEALRYVISHWMTQHLPPIRWFKVEDIEEIHP